MVVARLLSVLVDCTFCTLVVLEDAAFCVSDPRVRLRVRELPVPPSVELDCELLPPRPLSVLVDDVWTSGMLEELVLCVSVLRPRVRVLELPAPLSVAVDWEVVVPRPFPPPEEDEACPVVPLEACVSV